jgi:hypothetical protein
MVEPYRIAMAAGVTRSNINRASGIIRDVSVITSGKTVGHPFEIDAVTLSQVKACADAFPDGVKVKMDHGTGFSSIVGSLKSFHIAERRVRANLHLIKTHEKFNTILEMAETMPGSFGFSIVFSGTRETSGGRTFARCSELYSADLVDAPAANPTGLFSSTPKPGANLPTWTERCIAARKANL